METVPIDLLFFDVATYCILGFFGCLAFMIWYLRKHIDAELQERVRNAIWLENIFYYRDFTRKKFGRVHFVYPLTILFVLVVMGIFCLNIFAQLRMLESPFNYLLSGAVVLILLVLAGLVQKLSRKQFYE